MFWCHYWYYAVFKPPEYCASSGRSAICKVLSLRVRLKVSLLSFILSQDPGLSTSLGGYNFHPHRITCTCIKSRGTVTTHQSRSELLRPFDQTYHKHYVRYQGCLGDYSLHLYDIPPFHLPQKFSVDIITRYLESVSQTWTHKSQL